uniref:Uncharacterized protein n=1 Tax=Rhizophora mucronata TaxID=61149 RepID=A0A2P2NP10_RHIMU
MLQEVNWLTEAHPRSCYEIIGKADEFLDGCLRQKEILFSFLGIISNICVVISYIINEHCYMTILISP